MTNHYSIWISRPSGERLAVLEQFVRLEYRRVVNHTGHFTAQNVRNVLPLHLVAAYETLPLHLIERDTRLEIWRTVSGSDGVRTQELDTETVWLVRRVRKILTADGQQLVELGAVPALDLLNTRIVAYPAGSPQASKSGPADDVMKAIVRENMGILTTDITRELSDWLSVAPDLGAAPTVHKSFARRTLLPVLRELAAAAAQQGTPLYFDMVSAAPDRLEFRSYTGARGLDNTFPNGVQPVVLSPETGTLAQVDRTFDYEDEYSVVYAAGQGAEAERQVAEAGDSSRSATSPFGRRERFVDARHIRDPLELAAEAEAALAAGRPRRTFRALVRSTPAMAYGQHWRWGDRVTAAFADEIVQCHIDELHVTVENGRETVRAWLRADDAAPVMSSEHLAAPETETTYQQIQRGSLPAASLMTLPASGHLLAYGRYQVAGILALNGDARLVILT